MHKVWIFLLKHFGVINEDHTEEDHHRRVDEFSTQKND
jgi:hypothetical protein